MSSIDEIRDARINKLKLLKEKGVSAYPAEVKREISLKKKCSFYGKITFFRDVCDMAIKETF